MRGVILTAGRGWRLQPVTGERPKCLATVGGCTILERQLHALRMCGVSRITVVTGYRSDDVRSVCGPMVDFVLLGDGFVVLNCDVVFHRQLLTDLLTARYEDALLVAFRGREERYSEEEMKLRIRNGRVTDITKAMHEAEADAENIGIAKFGPAGAAVLVEEMDRLVPSGAIREWVPAAYAGFCWRRPLYVVDHRGFPWIEIDSPHDYWRACTHVAPALDEAVPTGGGVVAADPGARTPTVRRAADHV